jgi:signal transduction histidine kinase
MLVISCVVIAALTSIYLSANRAVWRENLRQIKSYSFEAFMPETAAPESVAIFSTQHHFAPLFSLLVDDAGKILEINGLAASRGAFAARPFDTIGRRGKPRGIEPLCVISSRFGLSEAACAEAVKLVFAGPADSGTVSFEGRQWMYLVSDGIAVSAIEKGRAYAVSDGNVLVAFLDVTGSNTMLRKLLSAICYVGLAVLVALFFVCLHFANLSIKPMEKSWREQRRFVANASHELKTPLSVIGANCDALLANGNETVVSQREWIGYMKLGIGKMTALINDLLTLAKAETVKLKNERACFDIGAAVSAAMSSMELLATKKGIAVSRSIEQGVIVQSSPETAGKVFQIVYENAIKHADTGGHISVELKRKKRRAVCVVGNSGAGIPDDELPRIFDRFYRGDKSRSGENPGFGLGLSIARELMDGIGGAITAKSGVENGGSWTEFRLVFRLAH